MLRCFVLLYAVVNQVRPQEGTQERRPKTEFMCLGPRKSRTMPGGATWRERQGSSSATQEGSPERMRTCRQVPLLGVREEEGIPPVGLQVTRSQSGEGKEGNLGKDQPYHPGSSQPVCEDAEAAGK